MKNLGGKGFNFKAEFIKNVPSHLTNSYSILFHSSRGANKISTTH